MTKITTCCFFRCLSSLCASLAAYTVMAATTVPPIMGWSSWNTYRVNISDSLIIRQADAMISTGLHAVGYNYVNIDDGFFGYRDKTGMMHPHHSRFPRGIKCVADYMHSLGLKAGIYSDAGAHTCGSRYDNDKHGFNAGLYGHERQDARTYFKDWGFDFIKIDYCGAGYELNLDEQRRYTEIKQAFDAEGCSGIAINICRWAFPGTWAKDIAASWRISSDINPQWSSVKNIIDQNLYLSAYCADGHYNDMDMLEIGRGLKPNEEEVHFGMWCIMSSPLLIGCDLTKIQPSSLALLKNKELIALNQDSLSLQAHVAMRQGEGYVLVKDIEQRNGLTRAVALYNPTDSLCSFSVPVSELCLSGNIKLRDLLHHKDIKLKGTTLNYKLEPRSIRIFRIEGQQRLEPTRYEAEWAYLPCFDALGKRQKQILYTRDEQASGGMIVANIGGRKENTIRWTDVFSHYGGDYDLTISYIPASRRRLDVNVNGTLTSLGSLPDNGHISTITIPIKLHKGRNVIEMGSPYVWAVDIDKFELKKK